jgi:predicted permease
MSFIGRVRKRIRAGAARRRLEREMQEEMREHLERAAERCRARGMGDADAMLAARREFGNVGVTQEEARDARGLRWIDSALGDLRHARRQFARTPLMTATIILTLTLGLAASAGTFSVLSGMLDRPAPGVPADPALVAVRGIALVDVDRWSRGQSYQEVLDYARLPEFADVAGWASSQVVVEFQAQDPTVAEAQFVTPTFFRVLGLRPIGAGFLNTNIREYSSPELTTIIGYAYAVERFGGPEAAIGQTLRVNGVNVTIAGVAPPRFIGVSPNSDIRRLWIPVSAKATIEKQEGDPLNSRTEHEFFTVARLTPGVSMERAGAAVKVVAARASQAQPPQRTRRPPVLDADVAPLRVGQLTYKSSQARVEDITGASVVVGLVVLIVLVCTTTVSSLLVGAAVARRHEIAVRLALGASRARIIRQLLTESAGLSLAAAGLGLAVHAALSRVLRTTIVDIDIDPTWTTALVTAGVAVAVAVLCGLSPALHATRGALSGELKDSATTATVRSRLQRFLVAAQVALTQPLLFGLAALVAIAARQAGPTAARQLGESVVEARFQNWTAAAQAENKLPALMARYAALPGVISVVPQSNAYMIMRLEAPPTPGKTPRTYNVRFQQATGLYFSTAGIRLVRGRTFLQSDSGSRNPPLILASDFASRLFGDVDPIGRRLRVLSNSGSPQAEVEIIGIVDAADAGNSEMGTTMRVFTPFGRGLGAGLLPDAMLIRTRMPAKPLISTFMDIARTEAPMTPVLSMQTLAEIERHRQTETLQAMSASALGGIIALVLASIGLYAVVALSVGQRRREIGVRISLGARPGQVVAMFFRSGLRVSLIGLAIGIPLSAAALKIVGTQIGLPRTNMPAIAAVVALAVVAVASLASWIPARRAARVDPLIALRDG